jgi:lipopolysaccharide/colanic/teichoic acid biosynthesis glycosyltransferase
MTPIENDTAQDDTHVRAPATMLRTRAIASLGLADIAAISGGFLLTWVGRPDFIISRTPLFMAVLLPVYLVVAASVDAFDTQSLQNPFRAIKTGWYALVVSLATVVIAAFYLRSVQDFSRMMIGFGSAFAFMLTGIARWFVVRRMPKIVGGNPFGIALIHDGTVPIPPGEFSVVLNDEFGVDPGQHDPMMYDRLAVALSAMDRVVVSCAPAQRQAWARALRGANIQGEIDMPELAALHPRGLGPDHTTPSLIVAVGPLNLVDRIIKRVFDLGVASVSLIIMAPMMLAVAAWVRYDSPGPILFRQVRIGRSNRMFRMYKFRSMRVTDSTGHRSASRDDDRMTRCGRFIRRTSIDELPQLFNVLAGSMSIVGPRPHALGSRANDKLFWEVDDRYWDRHATKPGLTGLAQVRGYRGATLVEEDLRNRVDADLEYLNNWSIWRDLKIIFLTIRVLFHRNAF